MGKKIPSSITFLSVVFVAVSAMGLATTIYIKGPKDSNSTPAIASILGFASTLIVSIFTYSKVDKSSERQEQHDQEAKERSETAKVNQEKIIKKLENTEKKVDEVITQGIKLKIEGKEIPIAVIPTNAEDLQELIHKIVKTTCGKLSQDNIDLAKTLSDSNKELHTIKHDLKGLHNASSLKDQLIEKYEKDITELKLQLEEHRRIVEPPTKVVDEVDLG